MATAEDEAVVTVDVEDAEGEEESAMRRRSGELGAHGTLCCHLRRSGAWCRSSPVMQLSWASETGKLTLHPAPLCSHRVPVTKVRIFWLDARIRVEMRSPLTS